MSSPTTSPRTLTHSELDALPVGAAVRCTTERGMRVVLALKVGAPQGSGEHIWRTTEYSTVPGSFAIASADAVLLEPVEPGHRAPDVQVDEDNPALAAAAVQDDALTGTDQGSDVGNARHEPDVRQSRHDAPRDIPSSAGGPATTPALARATEAMEHEERTSEQTAPAELDDLRQALAAGEASDGFHTHAELYAYRRVYNAALFNEWHASGRRGVVKSWRHSDGAYCFGGGWFIVVASLPTGQISNHYQAEHWDLFQIPEVELPPVYDGHTPAEALERLRTFVSEEAGRA